MAAETSRSGNRPVWTPMFVFTAVLSVLAFVGQWRLAVLIGSLLAVLALERAVARRPRTTDC